MRTFVIGCNHRTAPLEVREKLAFDDSRCAAALGAFQRAYPDAETVILSTCNRTEVYLVRPLQAPPRLHEAIEFLARQQKLDSRDFASSLYYYEDSEAIRHLFRVVSSLDSMVIGESQILGQAKHAFALARGQGVVKSAMDALFQHAFNVAKQVHSQTEISAGHVSVGSVALDFAHQIFTRFDDKVVMMIGAGEMGELTLKHLIDHHPRRVLVTNRTAARAEDVARRLGVQARPFERLLDLLVEADIVLTSTGSPEPIVTAELCAALPQRRKYRSLLMIDLAVPRDIEEAVGRLDNVFVYDIDDLQRITEKHWAQRRSNVLEGEQIIQDRVAEFLLERARRDVGPVVTDLRRHFEQIARGELKWVTPKLKAVSQRDRELIEQMLNRVINKVLHRPVKALNEKGQEGRSRVYAETIRRLFGLEPDE
ncbi:MAG: glutamyl-tRNA reductase [Phycisphaerales bacterium]|nr:MAG: glutamyl-tRNA reductase [Phycisphaerales bacterium]